MLSVSMCVSVWGVCGGEGGGSVDVDVCARLLSVASGDGGNDVSMIQAANVGLGIVGKVS